MPKMPLARPAKSSYNRREFLKIAGVAAAGVVVSSCQPAARVSTPAANISPTTAPANTAVLKTASQVAIGQATDYKRDTIAAEVHKLIDQLGGLTDVVKPGDTVAIKVNLTGGVYAGQLPGVKPIESFITHPEVARALVTEVKAAGAKEIYIVESAYEPESFTNWDYDSLANDTGAKLINLTNSSPFKDFIEATVGPNSFIYPSFIFNQILRDVDVFMSVSKMKSHTLAGVSHTMKNLYGLVPYRFYRLSNQDKYRSAFHGAENETKTRLPRVIMDINRARPIHFSLIDGIKAIQGAEGPWGKGAAAIAPGVLLAGKNALATDAVATAVMGHDPTAEYPTPPFLRTDNHLNLAAKLGLGTNRLEEIEVLGASIESVRTPFTPPW